MHRQPKSDDDDFEQLSSVPSPARRQGLSLKARAIGFLSRREHSRVELARKLAPHADPDDPNQLEQLLNDLERENWLSNERFAVSLAHRLAPKKGVALVMQQLKQHGLADDQTQALREQLQSTEVERASAVWQKKFGQAPADAKEYARQFRFLASRGFSANCLRQILGDLDDMV